MSSTDPNLAYLDWVDLGIVSKVLDGRPHSGLLLEGKRYVAQRDLIVGELVCLDGYWLDQNGYRLQLLAGITKHARLAPWTAVAPSPSPEMVAPERKRTVYMMWQDNRVCVERGGRPMYELTPDEVESGRRMYQSDLDTIALAWRPKERNDGEWSRSMLDRTFDMEDM